MSYTKLGFESGQVLEAEQLNHMESGIEAADITGADGVIKQEHLPEGYPYKTVEEGYILEECQPIYSEGMGTFVVTEGLHYVEVGKEYTVTWNGTEYNCVVKIITSAPEEFAHFVGLPALGNFIVVGGENTGEPFAILCVPKDYVNTLGFAYGVIPLDGSTQIMLSIKGETTVYEKINLNYLPSNIVNAKADQNYNITECEKNLTELHEMAALGRDIILRIITTTNVTVMARLSIATVDGVMFSVVINKNTAYAFILTNEGTWTTENIF